MATANGHVRCPEAAPDVGNATHSAALIASAGSRCSGQRRHGIFGVGGHLIAVPADAIEDIFILPPLHRAPGGRPHERGLASLRGKALPALDMRVCFGMTPALVELEDLVMLLTDREKDHRAWLEELFECVRDGREFTLTKDPRQCKFGRWYYSFRSDDAVLRMELERFDQPHRAIHEFADRVLQVAAAGQKEKALEMVDSVRHGVLEDLIQQFGRTRETLRRQHREIGVTVVVGGVRTVLVMDSAEAVADLELLSSDDDPLLSGSLAVDLVTRLARWSGAQRPILVVDHRRIIAS